MTAATQDVTAVNVSSLPDGTLTFSVTLTNAVGNTGVAATATATLDQTAPSGYTINSDQSTYNAITASSAGFTFADAEVGDTYTYTISSAGGGTAVTGTGTVSSATRMYRHQYLVVARRHADLQRHIDRPGRQHGCGGHGHGDPRPDRPERLYDQFRREHVQRHDGRGGRLHLRQRRGGRYVCLHDRHSTGGTAVTGTGTVSSATEDVTDINISSLPDGTLTFSVTLTDPAGNTGAAATAAATLDQAAPSGYTINSDQSTYNAITASSAGFTFADAEVGDTYAYTISSSAGGTAVTGTGTVILGHGGCYRHQYFVVARRHAHLQRDADQCGRQHGCGGHGHGDAGPDGPERLYDQLRRQHVQRTAPPAGFTFADAEVGDTYTYTISSSGGGTAVTGNGQRGHGHSRRYGDQYLVVAQRHAHLQRHIDRPGQQHRCGRHGHGDPHQTAPSGYTISSDASTYNATTSAAAGFTFADAEVGDTYAYTIDSSTGGTA